jgi:hypothetical protein
MRVVLSLVLTVSAYTSVGWTLAGCAETGLSHGGAQAGNPVTVEDHLEAALMYDKQARQLELEALKFEDEHARITTFEDPKGFRRSALKTAAQRCRKEVAELNELAAQHRQKAEEVEKKRGG